MTDPSPTAGTFPAGPHTYRIATQWNAVAAYHVARRMADTLIWLNDFNKAATIPAARAPLAFAKTLCAVTGRLSDADAEYVINSCLGTVQRQQGAAWAPVRVGEALMFDDMKMVDMLVIVWHVINAHGLIDFFGDPSGDSEGKKKAAAAPGSSGSPSQKAGTTSSARSSGGSAVTKA